jgi:hypothetical protein
MDAARAASTKARECCVENCPREFAPDVVVEITTPVFGCKAPLEYAAAQVRRGGCANNERALVLAYAKWCYCQLCWRCFDYPNGKFKRQCNFTVPYVTPTLARSVLQPIAPDGWCRCRSVSDCRDNRITRTASCVPKKRPPPSNCYLRRAADDPDLAPPDCAGGCEFRENFDCGCEMRPRVLSPCKAARGFDHVCPSRNDTLWRGGGFYGPSKRGSNGK